ncbi:MAG: NHLP family bacteriocin export ABC transporter peptidase/permease/ATPase subunit [Richelia sp. RM2_1_2]|nr:NHLP family bacteriocin export ABC transporter peptidase/permease/ATPase subunit [Richelia sp. RM2_1_2]
MELNNFLPTSFFDRILSLLRQERNPGKQRVKTPTVLQMEAVECGAAALGIILGYYGKIVPLPEIRKECGVSRDGSKASSIIKAAKKYGLQANGYQKEINRLQQLPPPYIVFWNFNHFLVVEGWNKDRIYINDPATGPRIVSIEEFDEAYTGIVLRIEPSPDFFKSGSKPNIISSLWQRLQKTIDVLLYCVLAGFLLTIIGVVIPIFSQIYIDKIIGEGQRNLLTPLLFAMVIFALLQGSLTLLRLRYLRRMRVKLAVGMSSHFFWHLLRLPVSFYAQRYAGEISDRSNLNDQVADVLSGQLATTAIDAVMIIFYALFMLQYDTLLTIIVVTFAILNVVTLQFVSRKRVDANQKLIQHYGKAAGVSIAALSSIETLKASGLESDVFTRWSGYYAKATNSQQELGLMNQVFSVMPMLLSAISNLLLLVVGSWRIIDGDLTVGALIAFQGLMFGFQEPVKNLLSFGSTLQELEGNLVRLDDVLQNPIELPESQESELDESCMAPKLQGYVELKNVTFGFSHLEPPLIENFNLVIKPGQRIALVGGSGSGKSTIAKLISGLYQPWSGEILFDGKTKQQIPQQIFTNSVAMVEQDILLFRGTIRDNLTLWDSTIPDKSMLKACEDAAIEDVVLSMPGGLDAELIEGATNLSGGQRQRLEIARALVNNPSILLMDEATSALDSETERIIDRNLRLRGCTCIIVAHRLSTIRDSDEIIILEHGKVVQRGTHQEMSQVDGAYSQLIRTHG